MRFGGDELLDRYMAWSRVLDTLFETLIEERRILSDVA